MYTFRVDSGTHIGHGHVQRCLTLAGALQESGSYVEFICCDYPGNLIHYVSKIKGFYVNVLPVNEIVDSVSNSFSNWSAYNWQKDAEKVTYMLQEMHHRHERIEGLIVDHYGIEKQWEQYLRPYVAKIMVIDDLANREHDCDVLLDQNIHLRNDCYKGLVHEHCTMLLGPQYALLREEFLDARQLLRHRTGEVKRALISFGGSDATNETTKALKAVKALNQRDYQISVDVVVGKGNSHIHTIRRLINEIPNSCCHIEVDYMAKLMANADLAIGAGGSSAMERCYMELPCITIITADNQEEVTESLAAAGAITNLGWYTEVSELDIGNCLKELIDNRCLKTVSGKASQLMRGSGKEGIASIIRILKSNKT